MLALTKKQTTKGFAEIRLSKVPADKTNLIAATIEKVLTLAGHPVREVNERGEELYSLEEVFPDMHVGNALRGLRRREELTQQALANMIGASKSHISEMEHGKRPIGKNMAKRLAKALNTNYKVFL